jgi:hypothetical protein
VRRRAQTNHDLGARTRRSDELDLALVGVDQLAHDCQPETRASMSARRCAPEPVERAIPLLGSHAGAFVLHSELDPGRRLAGRDPHDGARRRVVERVRDQVVEDLHEPRLAGADGPDAVDVGHQAHVALGGKRLPGVDAVADARVGVDGLGARRVCFRACQRKEALDQGGESLGLGQRAAGVAVLESKAKSRQRSPELVRGVGHELLLSPQQPAEPGNRAVEHTRQRANLRRADVFRRPRIEIPATDRRCRRLEPRKRSNDEVREPSADERGSGEDDRRDCCQECPVASDTCVERGRRISDANRAVHLPARRDRHSGVEETDVKCLRIPLAD